MKKATIGSQGYQESLNKALHDSGLKEALNQGKGSAQKIKCPSCKQDIELTDKDLKFHKHGRRAECPLCHKGIVMRKFVKRAP